MWTRLRIRLYTTPSLFLLFLGVTLLLLVMVIFKLPESIASLTWPTVEGVVLISEIHSVYVYPDFDEGWCPSVSYGYSVAQREYVSDNVEIQDICIENIGDFAYQVVQRYPVGKPVTVYYNPQNPAFAVLEPGIPNFGVGTIWPLLITVATSIGIAFFAVGILGVLGVLKFPASKKTL